MAESTGGGTSGRLPAKLETLAIPNLSLARVTRRQRTLIVVTGLLNILFVCSVLCIIVQIYQIVSDPDDSTNVASEVLTFTSVRTSYVQYQVQIVGTALLLLSDTANPTPDQAL